MSATGWSVEALAVGVRAGESRALARAISLLEAGHPLGAELLRSLGGEGGVAHAVGVTGPPGAGKSTLISALVGHARAEGRSVAVVSVDPTSPFSQGALLGDRIRLAEHFLDPGVFIRSMGSRGEAGGLAASSLQTLLLLEAAGKEVVFLETVGTGQGEVAVRSLADTVVLVLMPGSGDSVQALKAGIMEIPDLIVLNKRDLPGAQATLGDLAGALSLAAGAPAALVATDARSGEGTGELWGRIESRRAEAAADGSLARRRGDNLVAATLAAASRQAHRYLERATGADPGVQALLEEVRLGRLDPLSAADEILHTVFRIGNDDSPTLADIEAARARIAEHARVTPVYGSETLLRESGRPTMLKAENLQRTGSFKIRGATNRLATLTAAERAAGVIAASAGNHGQAVAWAARELGIHATIFMPEDAPMAKVEPTLTYGAEIVLAGAGFDAALAGAQARVEETGATFVHAFDDEQVIAGQGTLGLELAEQLPDVGTVLVPVGGGGLAAGIAVALRALRPETRIVGVHVKRDGYTIADGIAVKQPGELTMGILDDTLDDLVEVNDEEISQAITLLLERSKLLVEGAGAVGVAALLAGRIGGSGSVCAVISGGNIDPTTLITVLRHGLTLAGRYLVIRARLIDRPGELFKLLQFVVAERGNIVQTEHRREGVTLEVGEVGIDLTIVTRNEEHCRRLIATLGANGFPVERLG